MTGLKNLFISLFVLLFIVPARADNEELFQQIDEAITRSDEYVKVREGRIAKLVASLNQVRTDAERYEVSNFIFQEYQPYKSDSAIYYLGKCYDIALRLNDKSKACESLSNMVYMFSSTGQYAEGRDILASIDTVGVDRDALGRYFISAVHLYGELGYYSRVKETKERFYTRQHELIQDLYRTVAPDDEAYMLRKELECYDKGELSEALAINDKRMRGLDENSHQYAIVAFYRFLILSKAGRMEEADYWLAKATLNDIRNAVMDQGALWELARVLKDEGQLERSRVYINFAWQSANTFATRLRSSQISPIITSIDNVYQQQIEDSNRILRLLIAALTVMAVALAAGLIFVYRQHNRLSLAHSQLEENNKEVVRLNNELTTTVSSLDDSNRRLKDLIAQLNEQTKIKEEYIGHFMRLCSDYIDKIDDFRRKVNRLVKNKEYDELNKLTKSTDMKKADIEELCVSFDNAFLHLFPNFVNDFNSLLKDDEHIEEPGEYKLNTTLRIFALIRLGIDDSSKIADFLHYSVNTIYNYRARVKSFAKNNRENFEQRVKEIGMM